jgi:hypothetical protein
MSDLLDRLKAGQSALGNTTVSGVKFGLRLLSEQDYMDAGFAVDREMTAAGVELSVATSELFETEKTAQLLFRALVDPDTGKQVATNVKQLREALSRDNKHALMQAYLDHEKTFSPSERTLTDGEFSDLVEEVKKNPSTPHLNDLSIDTLKRLITTLVCPPTS